MNAESPQPEGTGPGLLDAILKDKRVRTIGLGLLGVVALIAFVNSFGDDEAPFEHVTTTTLASPATSSVTSSTIADGHQIPPIDGCTLLSSDEVVAALGLPETGGLFQFSGRESCVWQPDDRDVSVAGRSMALSPGDPTDFEPDAVVDGAAGTPVEGVGDLALWFAGTDTGTLSVAKETDRAILFMRLAITRPDIDNEGKLALAIPAMSRALQLAEFGPPDPIEVNLCDLIADNEAEALLAPHRAGRAAARDPFFVTSNFGATADLTKPGDFECTKLILTEIYVKATTAGAMDFAADAELDGVPGRMIEGLGDAAVWFEAVPFSSPFASPHQIDVLSVASGEAGFRIVLALPEVPASERVAAARKLARGALAELPGEAGQLIVVAPEHIDTSNAGFVDNLLARVDSGDWALEDGLAATLAYFAGEVGEPSVHSHDELLDESGTGIIAMAQDYAATARPGPKRREVQRLLDLLLPPIERRPPSEQPGAPAAVTSFDGQLVAQEDDTPSEGEEPSGYAPPPPENAPFEYPAPAPPVPGECANLEPTLPGWATSGFEMEGYGPWTGAVLFPSPGLELGWNRETHLARALEALTASIDVYGAPPVCIQLLFSHHGGSYTFVEQRLNPEVCAIFINRPSQNRNADHFKQQLAADIAHCYIPLMFPSQYDVTYLTRRWWNHALAEYMSNLVYTDVNLEWRLSPVMRAQETSTPLVERQMANWMFFQEVANEVGNQGVADLVAALPGGNDPTLHELVLADLPGMKEFFHQFSERMSDAAVLDTSGPAISYTPPRITKQLAGPGTHGDDLVAFRAVRFDLKIPSDMYACITPNPSEDATLTFRSGQSGQSGGPWDEMPSEETPFQGDLVVVATSVRDFASFSLMVRDVHEEEDCEDEEEETLPPPPDPCECDPSDYFLVWQDIPDILKRLFSPRG